MKILSVNNANSNFSNFNCNNANFKAGVKVTIPARNVIKESYSSKINPEINLALECLSKAAAKLRKMVKNQYPIGKDIVIDKISKEELKKVKAKNPNFNPQHTVSLDGKKVDFFYNYKNINPEKLDERSDELAKNLYNTYKHLCEKK